MDLKGQTFTLEGVAASLLILIATYTIFQSTVVMSPSWSEFNNIQLKQLGYDILRVMDNPEAVNSSLRGMIGNLSCEDGNYYAPAEFSQNLSLLLNVLPAYGRVELIWFNGSSIETALLFNFSQNPTPNAVRVSRFVAASNDNCLPTAKIVEVRLTLWR